MDLAFEFQTLDLPFILKTFLRNLMLDSLDERSLLVDKDVHGWDNNEYSCWKRFER